MAQNIIIAGATYSSVPAINATKSGGGTAVFADTSDATATAAEIRSGKTAYVNGAKITGSLANGAIKNNTSLPSGSSSSGNLSYNNYIKIGAGCYPSDLYYKNGVAAGSASTPATIITTNPTISVSSGGLITASYSGSKSITPTVSAGYVSAGTAGTISTTGSATSQLSTIAATTYNTSSSNQTIAASKYLTGVQTIRAVTTSNISAANIKSGVNVKVGDAGSAGRIVNVTGTFTSDATATAAEIRSGKTAYVNGVKVTGTLEQTFAMILVNYQQNSTLTATNVDGYLDISGASSESPQRVYYVKKPSSGTTQTCVLTATRGTDTASTTVSDITAGTSRTIYLSFRQYLVENGTEIVVPTLHGVYKSQGSGVIQYHQNDAYHEWVYFDGIEIKQYNTLTLVCTSRTLRDWWGGCYLGITNTKSAPGSWSGSPYLASTSMAGYTAGTFYVDVSGYHDGTYYVAFDMEGVGENDTQITVSDIYLDY